jgi:hypothetical protein
MIELQLLLATFAAWANRRQGNVIASRRTASSRSNSSRVGGASASRMIQRRRLAAKGKPLGQKALRQIATIVTPETILAWHRRLIAAK